MGKAGKILTALGIALSSLYVFHLIGINVIWSVLLTPTFGFCVSAIVAIYFFFKNLEYKEEFRHMVDYVQEKDADAKYYEEKVNTLMQRNEELKQLANKPNEYWKSKYEESLRSLSLRDDLLMQERKLLKDLTKNRK